VDGLPIELSGDDAGWFLRAPVITVKLQCKPFGYGTPVTSSTASSATPFVTIDVAALPGDVSGEGRLLITDAATQNRRYAEWGLDWRYMNAALSYLVDSDDMATTGFAGAQGTRTGAYDPNASGNNVITATLLSSPLGICGTTRLSHVGTFRVKARVFAAAAGTQLRLAWQEGDGPFRANPYATPPLAGVFCEVDLGMVTIPPKQLGTQSWQGRIEAYNASFPGTATLDVDYLVLVPAGDGYGRVRSAVTQVSLSSIVGHDEFTTAAGGLNTRVAPLGGTWATGAAAGGTGSAATDFTAGTNTMTRTTTGDVTGGRYGALGATASTDVVAQVDFSYSAATADTVDMGLLLRFVDANNFVRAYYEQPSTAFPTNFNVSVDIVIAGTRVFSQTVAGSSGGIPSISPGQTYSLRAYVGAGGQFGVWVFPQGGTPSSTPLVTGGDTRLATGGTLASGKTGLYDFCSGGVAVTRTYDNFVMGAADAQAAVFSGKTAEIRYDGAIRQDSTGTYYGPVPAYRGSRFLVPAAGDENRTSRILVKAHRNDIEVDASANVTDNLTIQTIITPRYVVVPF
jgi:hypothetical protein